MDLKKLFKLTIEALDQRGDELSRTEKDLADRQIEFERHEKVLSEAQKSLEVDQKAVSDIADVKAQKEANEQTKQDLDQLRVELKKEDIRLKKYENTLYEIKGAQDEKDKELVERENAVSHREKTYKEEIEKNFAVNLASNLLKK